MARPASTKRWKTARKLFRIFRVSVLLLVFLAAAAVTYFHTVGLPDFLKQPLLSALRRQGWEVEFREIRWLFHRGIVIDDGTLKHTRHPLQYAAREIALKPDLKSLRQSELKLHSVHIKEGRLTYPLQGTSRPPLVLSNLNVAAVFPPDGCLVIESLDARFRDIAFHAEGKLENLAALGRAAASAPPGTDAPPPPDAGPFLNLLDLFRFAAPPDLKVRFRADAASRRLLECHAVLSAPEVETPWAAMGGLKMEADLDVPQSTNAPMRWHLLLAGDTASFPRGKCRDLHLRLTPLPGVSPESPPQTAVRLSARRLEWVHPSVSGGSNRIQTALARFDGAMTQDKPASVPLSADGRLEMEQADFHFEGIAGTNTADGFLRRGEVTLKCSTPAALLGWDDAAAGKNTPLDSLSGDWTFAFDTLRAAGLSCSNLAVAGRWNAPELHLSQCEGALGGGQFRLNGDCNTAAGCAQLNAASDFDWKLLAPLLAPEASAWMKEITWEKPPVFEGTLDLSWAEKTDDPPALRLLSTLKAGGRLSLEGGAFRGIPFLSADASLSVSNRVWSLPDLRIVRPEGELRLRLKADEHTRKFEAFLESSIQPADLRPALPETARHGLDLFQFTKPPVFQITAQGCWDALQDIRLTAAMQAGPFTFRDIRIDRLTADAAYGNKVVEFTDIHLERDDRRIDSPRIVLDFNTNCVFFTEVRSTVDPMLVGRAIRQEIADAIEPYRFETPPAIRLNGGVSLHDDSFVDLHFEVAGEKFRWGLFQADSGSADVHYLGNTLLLTNMQARAYKSGRLSGWVFLDYTPEGHADYRFALEGRDVDVQTLSRSLQTTNDIEGMLDGRVEITSADTRGIHTWRGQGQAALRDGLIWDIPLFGLFSPMLEAMVPGLGKSRAREAAAAFSITNGVFHTDDLEIRASNVRLSYRGAIDPQLNVDARVEAEVLRDTWLIGRVVSLALSPLSKLFEYKVTGPVENPKMEPVYIPRFLMAPLRPFHTIKSLFPEKTPAPPPPEPPPSAP